VIDIATQEAVDSVGLGEVDIAEKTQALKYDSYHATEGL
jgi:hypothetical protein